MSDSKLVEEYKAYDFQQNADFQRFLKEMQPPVPEEAMDLVKRHWYKRFVNQDFEPNFDGTLPDFDEADEKEHTHTHNGQKCNGKHDHKPQQENNFKSKLKRIAYTLENYLKMFFMLSAFSVQVFAHYTSIIICVLAIIRQLKRPRMTKQYVQQLSQNQFAQNLIYMFIFCFYREQRNIFYFFPLLLHFWIGICEYLNITKNTLYKKIEKLVTRTRLNKDRIMLLKSQYEIFYFPVLFVEIFFGRSSIFLVIFYYNFIKIKYLISSTTQTAFSKLNNGIKDILNKPGVPKFIGSLYAQVEKLFAWFVKHDPSSKKNPTPPTTAPETKQSEQSTTTTSSNETTTAEEQTTTADDKKSQ